MSDNPLPEPVQNFVDTIRAYCADGKEGRILMASRRRGPEGPAR